MNIGIIIPRIERGIFGEEVLVSGLRQGFQSLGRHSVTLFDERNLAVVYQHRADLWVSLSYKFNPAMAVGNPVCFHWNLHSPDRIQELGFLRYHAWFLNSTRISKETPCGPIYLLEPGVTIETSTTRNQIYKCRAVYVGNYSNRAIEDIAQVLDPIAGEDVAIWGLGEWDKSPWSVWHRGELPALDLISCYASADFVINITPRIRREHDMIPMRVLQALACGKPVISDFLAVLKGRYDPAVHFYGIDPHKSLQIDPEGVRDHDWRHVAERILTHYDEFSRPPAPVRTNSPKWLWDTRFGTASSLDIFSEYSIIAMEKQGVDIRVTGSFYAGTSPGIKRLSRKSGQPTADIYLNVLGGLPEFEKLGRFPCSIIYVFWAETTTILSHDVAYINRFDCALVQSTFSQTSLKASGVIIPVLVFPHGYNPDVFRWSDRSANQPFSFLQVGIIQKRKGTDLLLQAFTELFGHSPDVRLILKSRATDLNPHMQEMRQVIQRDYSGYSNIRLIEDDLEEHEIAQLYAQSDIQVYPSRGEGFAMPVLEGAATGLPVIATAHGGYMDYLNDDNAWLIPVAGFSRRDDLGWTHDCLWADPSYEDLKRLLWKAYEERNTLPQIGRHLYETVAETWTWDRVIGRCVPQIEAFAKNLSERNS